jgi:XRE family transcriptional regulator, regulator of sulfur utilization
MAIANNDNIIDSETQELKRRVGENLERLRKQRGLSLEKLATLSGVSRAMLGQIEAGESAPTIALLWKVAKGLDVRFADLLGDEPSQDIQFLPARTSKILQSSNGKRRAEFYELRLKPGHTEMSVPHPEGTYENLVVHSGQLVLSVGDMKPLEMGPGDSVYFRADLPHAYENPGAGETLMYLVMTYTEPRL